MIPTPLSPWQLLLYRLTPFWNGKREAKARAEYLASLDQEIDAGVAFQKRLRQARSAAALRGWQVRRAK